MHLTYLISGVKRMHENVGVNAFKMQSWAHGCRYLINSTCNNWCTSKIFCFVLFLRGLIFEEYNPKFGLRPLSCVELRGQTHGLSQPRCLKAPCPALLAVPAGVVAAAAFVGWPMAGARLRTCCLGLLLDICKVGSDGSKGSVPLRPISGELQGCGSRDQSLCERTEWTLAGFRVFLGMGMAKHTTLKLMSTHAILTRIKTPAKLTYWITPRSVFLGKRWVFVALLRLSSCIAALSKMPCFDLFSFPRISFQP